MGSNWFSSRVVDEWNELSNHKVNPESIGSFKRFGKFIDENDSGIR